MATVNLICAGFFLVLAYLIWRFHLVWLIGGYYIRDQEQRKQFDMEAILRAVSYTHLDVYKRQPHEGKIIGTRKPEDGGILYFVEIQEDIGPLISVRNAVTTMKKDYTGIKVSKKALFTEDTVLGIKVVEGNTTEFVPVTVVYEDGTDAIIQAAEEGTTLMAGSKVVLK